MKPIVGNNLTEYISALRTAEVAMKKAQRIVYKGYGSKQPSITINNIVYALHYLLESKYKFSFLNLLRPPKTRKVMRMERIAQ